MGYYVLCCMWGGNDGKEEEEEKRDYGMNDDCIGVGEEIGRSGGKEEEEEILLLLTFRQLNSSFILSIICYKCFEISFSFLIVVR